MYIWNFWSPEGGKRPGSCSGRECWRVTITRGCRQNRIARHAIAVLPFPFLFFIIFSRPMTRFPRANGRRRLRSSFPRNKTDPFSRATISIIMSADSPPTVRQFGLLPTRRSRVVMNARHETGVPLLL